MQFNPTVDFGDILVLLSVGVGIIKFYGDLRVIKFKVETMWDWFDERYADFPPKNGRHHG